MPSGPPQHRLKPHFEKLAAAYQAQNITAVAELFDTNGTAESVYVSHWGCEWISVATALKKLVAFDFANMHAGMMILSLPMSGTLKHSDNNTLSGSVKLRYMAHHTVNGKDRGLLATGYWFAQFDLRTQKFISFQSLAGLEDAPAPANATDMIAVSHRFISDWKHNNMTDFGLLLAPGFVATEQDGFPMNRSTFVNLHIWMQSFLVDYQCQYPASATYCDYVVDELAQTTQCKVPNNISSTTVSTGPSSSAEDEVLMAVADQYLNKRMNPSTEVSSSPSGNDGYTIVFTCEYQVHLFQMVKPETPIPGLPFQMLYLAEYEDMIAELKPYP